LGGWCGKNKNLQILFFLLKKDLYLHFDLKYKTFIEREIKLKKILMKKEIYLIILKQEIKDAIDFFEKDSNADTKFKLDEKTVSDIDTFFMSIKEMELFDIFEKVNQKYGWYLKYYRETKKNSDISTIKTILKFFLILTIISIIIGIIIGISIATS
jgi:hypothetical protein